MIDVFTEEIEVQIKAGISNLYWYRNDLKKAWLRSGVDQRTSDNIFCKKNEAGGQATKRQLMDYLYEELRGWEYNRRLEISRNLVRILIEHENFVPQNENHRIEIAERSALKLKEIIAKQREEVEYRGQIRARAEKARKEDYHSQLLQLRDSFYECSNLEPHKRGYELEKIFVRLMIISGIPVEASFKIEGEQIDGAIKYDGHFYLVEIKWPDCKVNQSDISSLYLKVEGKLEARGIFIAMNGYSEEMLKSLPAGKVLKVLLLDGIHLTNVICNNYTFSELLQFSLSQASLKGNIYCSYDLIK